MSSQQWYVTLTDEKGKKEAVYIESPGQEDDLDIILEKIRASIPIGVRIEINKIP